MNCYLSGDLVWVRFGGFGEQLAIVARVLPLDYIVHKWRDNSRTWTKRVRVTPLEIIDRAYTNDGKAVLVRRAVEQLAPQLGVEAPSLVLAVSGAGHQRGRGGSGESSDA